MSEVSMTETLAQRERLRELYWKRSDPILNDRMFWRAQTFRHIIHLLPGQSILEIGCGDGAFTRQLAKVTRGECPFTAISFDMDAKRPRGFPPELEFLTCRWPQRDLEGRQFDFIVAHELLDKPSAAWFLQQVFALLAPGGRVLFYESNPWNVIRRLRDDVAKSLRPPKHTVIEDRIAALPIQLSQPFSLS